ncbi:MAG: hypothetical protein ABSA84_08280, partial [Gammaproteobacteria bacterium]
MVGTQTSSEINPKKNLSLKTIPEITAATFQIATKTVGPNQLQISYKCNNNKTAVITHTFTSEQEQLNIKTLIPNCNAELSLLADGSVIINGCDPKLNLQVKSPATIINTAEFSCNRLQLNAKRLLLQNNITTTRSCVLSYAHKLENYGKLTVGTILNCRGEMGAILRNFDTMVAKDDACFNDKLGEDIVGIINYGLIYSDRYLKINARKLYNYNSILSSHEIISFGKQLFNAGTIFSEKLVGLDYRGSLINKHNGIIASNGDVRLFRNNYKSNADVEQLDSSTLINQGKVKALNTLMVSNDLGIITNKTTGTLEGSQIKVGGGQFINDGKVTGSQQLEVILSHDNGRWYNKSNGQVQTKKLLCASARLVNNGVIYTKNELAGLLTKTLENQLQGQMLSDANMGLIALEQITNDCLIKA